MKKIEFDAVFGNERKRVEITQTHGAAGIYHVSVNRYHWGQMQKLNNQWQGYFNKVSEITGADIQILGEIIETNHLDKENETSFT